MDELTEILADGPHFTSKETEKVAVLKDERDGRLDDEDVGSVFELNNWV